MIGRHTTTANTRILFQDGDTTLGEILTAATSTGRQLFVALAHDWDGDHDGYDPIVVDTTDDREQAEAEIKRRWETELAYRAHVANGAKVTVTGVPGVWVLEQRLDDGNGILVAHDEAAESYLHSQPEQPRILPVALGQVSPWKAPEPPAEFDAQAAYEELNPKQRAAMRNVLASEDDYNGGAVTARGAYSRVSTMDALTKRGLLERKITSLPFNGSGFKYGYRLTPEGRAVAARCEEKSVKIHHPADDGDPFAGMGTADEED